jgi:formate/nitrite transporter FocA (FNT family)
MYFIPVGFIAMVQGGTPLAELPWFGFLVGNMIPVTLGNLVGGAGFTGILYWYTYLQGNRE